ncbi:MAG: hypothetical protein ACYC67_10180 [Prosthecobacter sp.]
MIPSIAHFSKWQPFWRGIPHERTEFAWTPGALTSKIIFSGNERRKQCRFDCEVRGTPDEDHRHGVAGDVSHFQMQAVQITLETAKIRRD